MTGRWWDETTDGSHCREIDRVTWSERVGAAGDPPPAWMRPVGRRSAETAAARLRVALALCGLAVVPAALVAWSLGVGR